MIAAQINDRLAGDECAAPFFSLEFFPPQRDQEKNMADFMDTLNYLKEANPLFIDITWSRRNDPGNLSKRNSSSAIAVATGQSFGNDRTMLHVCCNDHTKAETVAHVEQAIRKGIRNIMALRGDDLPGELQNSTENGCTTKYHAIDLVKWTRELEAKSGDGRPLTVAVAGHMHPPLKTVTYAQCMAHLKSKVDAGADFIVTQFFLEVELFEKFRADCRSSGILVPILPGILLFKNAASLRKMAELANVPIPAHIVRFLDMVGTDQMAVQNFAMQLAFDMCRHILSTGQAPGIHFFTLNQRDMCGKLLRRMGFWPTINSAEQQLNGAINGLYIQKGQISPKSQMNGSAEAEERRREAAVSNYEAAAIMEGTTKLPLNMRPTSPKARTTA